MSLTRWLVSVCLWLVLLSSAVFAQTVSNQSDQAPGAKLHIVIERQLVRFTTPGEAVEWRLVVTNQQEEVIFESGLVYGHALEWPLKNQQDEAVQSGLYAYTLTIKAANDETARAQRGHLIIDRASNSDRVWVTSTQAVGIGSEAPQVSVVGSREVTVGGAELPATAPRREVSTPRDALPQRANAETANEKTAAPTAPAGTVNRVAKFAADGASLVDSTITEVSGNVGIGTTNPQSGLDYRHGLAPFFTRDIGTTNFGTPQSALQLGVTNLGSRNGNVGPSFLFFADNSAGAKSFLGRVSGAWENPTAGAETGAILFQTRANSGDTGASTERMRITAGGNVGIGTALPSGRLHVHHSGSFTPIVLTTGSGPEGAARFRLQADSGLFGQGRSFVIYDDATSQYRLVINGSGNVGFGTTTPAAKLQVVTGNTTGVHATSQANAIAGISTTAGYAAIYGENNTSGSFGVYGKALSGSGVQGEGSPGVVGTSATTNGIGVYGKSSGVDGKGVYGEAYGYNGTGVYAAGSRGIAAYAVGSGGYAIFAKAIAGDSGSYAGLFDGKVGILDSLEVHNDLKVLGDKDFVEPHPTDPNKMIQYVALEGPEAGTYFRGSGRITGGVATIQVPEDFRLVSDEKGLTVQVTPLGEPATIWCVKKSLDKIELKGSADVEFDYLVNGVRRLSKDHQPIVENTIFIPRSADDKPFKHLKPAAQRRLKDVGILNEDGTANMETVKKLDAYKRRYKQEP
jgi:hypothetical protein